MSWAINVSAIKNREEMVKMLRDAIASHSAELAKWGLSEEEQEHLAERTCNEIDGGLIERAITHGVFGYPPRNPNSVKNALSDAEYDMMLGHVAVVQFLEKEAKKTAERRRREAYAAARVSEFDADPTIANGRRALAALESVGAKAAPEVARIEGQIRPLEQAAQQEMQRQAACARERRLVARRAAELRQAAEPSVALCARCQKKPRHFEELCKRCANELGQRPSGKV